ncbi:MAG: hypothetical protein IM613_16475 [Cytophagales bacterium]|jgi:hypothetical protein|nr:hypothetical protein [Cytophagales bacterium]
MVPTKPAIEKMGEVGERVVQTGKCKMAQTEVRRKAELIRTLEVGISIM